MDYQLTEHAQDALAKRQIALQWVEQVLATPQWSEQDPIDPDLKHRLARISDFGNRVLRVVVNVKTQPPRIVTAYFDRRRNDR